MQIWENFQISEIFSIIYKFSKKLLKFHNNFENSFKVFENFENLFVNFRKEIENLENFM